EVPPPPSPRYTPEDLDQAKAAVEARASEHQQAVAELQEAQAARAAPPAGKPESAAGTSAASAEAPVLPPEIKQLRASVETASGRLKDARAATRTDKSPQAAAAVADAQF